MCREYNRRRKGTAAATFVIYEGSAREITNQVNALLDGGAKILQTKTVVRVAAEMDYAVSILFVANYFHPAVEKEELGKVHYTADCEQEVFENAGLSEAEDGVDSSN